MVTLSSGVPMEAGVWVMGCTARSWGHCGPGEEAKGTDTQVPSPASMLLPIETQVGHGPA